MELRENFYSSLILFFIVFVENIFFLNRVELDDRFFSLPCETILIKNMYALRNKCDEKSWENWWHISFIIISRELFSLEKNVSINVVKIEVGFFFSWTYGTIFFKLGRFWKICDHKWSLNWFQKSITFIPYYPRPCLLKQTFLNNIWR